MADDGDCLPDVQEKKLEQSKSDPVDDNAAVTKEVDEMKEQLQVHIETIGILLAEKTELESSLSESQKIADVKQAAIEELDRKLKAFSACSTDASGKCSCNSLSSFKDSEVAKLQKQVEELTLQRQLNMQTLEEFKAEEAARTKESKSRFDELAMNATGYLKELSELKLELNAAKVENEALRAEHANLLKNLEISQERSHDIVKTEKESLQREYVQQREQLETRLRLLDESLNASIEKGNGFQKENAELKERMEKLMKENERLMEQLALRDSKAKGNEQSLEEQRTTQIKQLQTQVALLLSEKNQILGQRDEVQSVLEDLRLRYAVATEELLQSNEMVRQLTAEFNRQKTHTDHLTGVIKAQEAENLDLTRRLSEKMDLVQKLEASSEVLRKTASEGKQCLENQNAMMNGRTEEVEMLNGNCDTFEKYSKDLMDHLRQNAPLIERLQKELNSAQDTINALTNQNTELKNQLKLNPDELSALEASVMFEKEKKLLELQLEELTQDHRLVRERLEHVQQDLAQQVPATMNGDVVTRAHFEALQNVMKRLETKYTIVMRDKADLIDTIERMEHIITQLQDESNTIGEYVSLYHHQRFLLRQRTAEKDDYIYQLANERTSLQSQLTQLQMLIIQLLNERNVVSSSNNAGHQAMVEHSSQISPVDNTVLTSEPGTLDENHHSCDHSLDNGVICEPELKVHTSSTHSVNIPSEQRTAQKIMHLLSEIGSSKLVDGRPLHERNYVQCCHCSGQILVA